MARPPTAKLSPVPGKASRQAMKRFQWKILICVIPVLLALVYLAPKFRLGKAGFKLGTDLVGGTILVYEVDETKKLAEYKKEELAARIKRRIDPTDLKNITVRPIGDTRVEIILPTGGAAAAGKGQAITQEDVQYIKTLIAQVGSLEFRFLANERDDSEAIDKAEAYFKDLTDARKAELEKLAREGKAPPGPVGPVEETFGGRTYPVFVTDRGKLSYSWVELG